ncbi:MAG: class I SAM-dependent methyltransferase [Rhodocyclaceae bacterium]|nr:class I SAM-dependent methyltransferase [Rhodocyclaceae bacterium]
MSEAVAAPDQTPTRLHWREDGRALAARWRSEAGLPPPVQVEVVDDGMPADRAWRLACEGKAMLWRGDFHNARQLLSAIGRRVDRSDRRRRAPSDVAEAFHRHRMAQAQRARTLGQLLVPLGAGYELALRRAPAVALACREAWGEAADESTVVSLRELLGIIGAHQWRLKGVPIAGLGGRRIHPHYGVFSPIRGEYLDLVARTPLPSSELAFDLGTGTGVLAAVLARRGVERVVATDLSPRALTCARENLSTLGFGERVDVCRADLYPPGRAPLVVCNPPWLPGKAASPLDAAVYDPDSRMLRGFIDGLGAHLAPDGEGWLILSDLAERLQLRPREVLLGWIERAGLEVLARDDIRPRHRKAFDRSDPLHGARGAEITSLWRLVARR